MDKVALNKSLRTILRTAQARSAERVGLKTLADFASAIEQYGLARPQYVAGDFYFADPRNAPMPGNFGRLAWMKILDELYAAGFDWRPYLVEPLPDPRIAGQTDMALWLAITGRIDELIALLREYQRRHPKPGVRASHTRE